MADAERLASVRTEIAALTEGRELKERVRGRAEEALSERLPKHFRDKQFLGEARNTLKYLQALGIMWLLDRSEGRYVERARELLRHVCKFPDWDPGHFLDTAEMTHAVAIGYDWFYDELSPAERDACVAAMVEKGLKPGYRDLTGKPKPNWPVRVSNWNIVCNGGLMIGALAIADTEREWSTKVFGRCLDSIPIGFSAYSPSGSYNEGPGYWAYATEYAAYLLSALDTALGHDLGLGKMPGFSETGLFRMHVEGSAAAETVKAKFFNFSDSPEEHRGSWAMRWLAHRFDKPMYNRVAWRDRQNRPMDLVWFKRRAPDDDKGIRRHVVFHGFANVAMLRGNWTALRTLRESTFRPWDARSSTDSHDVFLGVRAGTADPGTSHAQLDLGSFVLDSQGVRWAVDLAPSLQKKDYPDDYDLEGFFDVKTGQRYRYYRTGTIGHNTLVVQNANQLQGALSEIVAFGGQPSGVMVVVVDLTAAYPDCESVLRGFAMIEGRDVLIVDEVTPKRKISIAWQMHTRAKARGGNVAHLSHSGGKNCYVQILEPAGSEFAVEAAGPTQPLEAPNEGVGKLVARFARDGPIRISVYASAERRNGGGLPAPLDQPLSRWIEWAEKSDNKQPMGQLV